MNSVESQLMNHFFNVYRSIRQKMLPTDKECHMTIIQLHALIFLNNKNSSQVTEIADYLHISIPTVTVLIDKLVEEAFVLRQEAKEDRRMMMVSLTKKGKEFLEDSLEKRKLHLKKILSKLSSQDKKELIRILDKLI
jgi:DNA-binding MarR family transcriptional regulator